MYFITEINCCCCTTYEHPIQLYYTVSYCRNNVVTKYSNLVRIDHISYDYLFNP